MLQAKHRMRIMINETDTVGVETMLPRNWKTKFHSAAPHDRLHAALEDGIMAITDELNDNMITERLITGFKMLSMTN